MIASPRSGCPVNATVEAFGDQWSLLVLRDVMFGNRRHFNKLLAGSEEGIASNILADRLRRLVRGGLLTRVDAGRGRKARYSLTEAAIELVPVFAELGAWGVRHRPASPELAQRAQRLAEGGPELWAKFMSELRQAHLTGQAPTGKTGPEPSAVPLSGARISGVRSQGATWPAPGPLN